MFLATIQRLLVANRQGYRPKSLLGKIFFTLAKCSVITLAAAMTILVVGMKIGIGNYKEG